jgi:hypothetical protein
VVLKWLFLELCLMGNFWNLCLWAVALRLIFLWILGSVDDGWILGVSNAKVAYVLEGISSLSDLILFFHVFILTYSSLIFLFYRKWHRGNHPS